MAQVSFSIPEKAWGGLNTRFRPESDYVTPDQFTLGSYNFLTDFTGAIVKVPGGTLYSSLSNINQDQFEAIFSSGIRHLLEMEHGTLKYSSGDGVFHTVTTGYTYPANMEFAEYLNRVYFDNGIDPAQVYDINTTYGGVTYTAPHTKAMGAQPPVTAVTFAADSAGGAVPAGAHTYEVTFLYYGAEESNGGPASAVHTVTNPNNTVNLTAVPIGGYGVTARNIYRDNNDGNYLLVGTIPNNTATTFTDTQALGTLPIPLDNGIPPIFAYIVNHLDRMWMAGVAGNPSVLYWTAAGLPDIFNANGFLTCNSRDPISGLAVYYDRVMVFNQHSMGQILFRDSADFRYNEVTPNVGCIDNRSIQVRTIRGVPTLIWLSEFGWYEYNGSSVTAISTEIDDQLQLNITQAEATSGSITQSTQADFQGGIASPSIDLNTNPNFIQTVTPVREWELQTDWEGGSSLTNISEEDGSNTIKVPTHFLPTFATGTFNNTQVDSTTGDLELPTTSTMQTGEDLSTYPGNNYVGFINGAAQPITFTVNGTISSLGMFIVSNPSGNAFTYAKFTIWQDSGGDSPGTILYQGPDHTGANSLSTGPVVDTLSLSVTAGVKYWLGLSAPYTGGSGSNGQLYCNPSTNFNRSLGEKSQIFSFTTLPLWSTNFYTSLCLSYAFTPSVTSDSGVWISDFIDTFTDTTHGAVLGNLITSTTYPAGCTITALIQGTNTNPTGTPTWTTTDTISNPSGTDALTGSGYRYWQIVLELNAPTQFVTPLVAPGVILNFSTTGTWISEFIDHTTDVVSLDQLTPTDTIPAGTSITLSIATSADNVTYTSFVPFGTQTTQRYSKVQAVLTTTAANDVSPVLTNLLFTWTVTGTFQSSAINTGATPAGWKLFQSSFNVQDGSIIFFVRTAATSGGLTGATYVAVTNGAFITASVFPWIQYKAVITNHDTLLANIGSVTINWFITLVQGTRVASLFYKKRYYMAAEEFGNTTNNVVFVLDEFNTWKVIRGVTISTLGLFFNLPYYGDAATPQFVNWLTGNTNVGNTNIALDVRTKAFSKLPSQEIGVGADEVTIRWIRSLVIKLLGTGCTIVPTYSSDGGVTFLPMALVETGLDSYTSPNDGVLHAVRFSPVAEDVSSTRSILIRITNNDQYPVSISNMKITCMTSQRPVLNG